MDGRAAVFAGNHYRSIADLTAWLGQHQEPILEPYLAIVDAHHHLSPNPDRLYSVDDFLSHINGLNVEATVFVECGAGYDTTVTYPSRRGATEEHATEPIAETRYVVRSVEGSPRSAEHGVCAGIIGFVNLTLSEGAVAKALELHVEAGAGRFKGVRQSAAWDPFIGHHAWRAPPPGLLLTKQFRSGLRILARMGLVFDAWLYSTQLFDLVLLARAMPELKIILNHCGGIIGVGPYKEWPAECFALWRTYLAELARSPNVYVKIGGLGMPATGSEFHFQSSPPSSGQLAAAWKPVIDATVEVFGTERCMIGSNFPVDRQTANYTVLWNAYKRATQLYRPEERRALFSLTARRVYGLGLAAKEAKSLSMR
jgi:L-fuconolactonase